MRKERLNWDEKLNWLVFSSGGNEALEAGFVYLQDAAEYIIYKKDTDYEEDFIVLTAVEVK